MDILSNEVFIGALLGIFIWALFKSLDWILKRIEKYKGQNHQVDIINQDYGDFLEIPLEKIIAQQPTNDKNDLRALAKKINSFKSRNFFYQDIDLTIGKAMDDFRNGH